MVGGGTPTTGKNFENNKLYATAHTVMVPFVSLFHYNTQLLIECFVGFDLNESQLEILNLLNKLSTFLSDAIHTVLEAINTLSKYAEKTLAILNAYILGLIDGFMGLIQTVILLMKLIYESNFISLNPELNKDVKDTFSLLKEFEEDWLDLLFGKALSAIKGIIKTILDPKEHIKLVAFFNKLVYENRYLLIFIAGGLVFEIIVEVVLAYFTGGAGNVAKAAAGIRRLADKLQDLGEQGAKLAKKIAKEAPQNLAEGIRWILRQLDELLEAFKNGKFVEWVKEKMRELLPSKEIDDILTHDYLADWDKDLPVSGKGFKGANTLRRKEIKAWMDKVKKLSNGKSSIVILPKGHKLLKGNRAGFNPFNGNIYVQKGMTEYEIFHEFKHLEEFTEMGYDAYTKGMRDLGFSPMEDLIRTYKREKHVYDEVMKNSKKFNAGELKHAQGIINKVVKDGIDAGIDLSTY